MIYPIVLYGDPVLKKKAQVIEKEAIDLEKLVEDMFETMHSANGVGLAAPQIGKPIRLFVVDATPLDEDEEAAKPFRKVFVNPEMIDEFDPPWNFEEGCLSIPGIREDVQRHRSIRLKYQDENWEEHEEEFHGIHARIIQHEYDHLEGVLFTDHLSAFKKRLLKSKLTNISKGKCDADYLVKVPVKR